jgi:hypothetical protein
MSIPEINKPPATQEQYHPRTPTRPLRQSISSASHTAPWKDVRNISPHEQDERHTPSDGAPLARSPPYAASAPRSGRRYAEDSHR